MATNRSSLPPGRLERAVARLRPIEREVLRLSAGLGLSNAEIAARLGLRPGKAERILARALCRLDREIERREQPWWRFW
ncbi:MAG TPA: sigma factor-like helix-turn-helix DNA-binding protein [Sphingomicrobium sp.]